MSCGKGQRGEIPESSSGERVRESESQGQGHGIRFFVVAATPRGVHGFKSHSPNQQTLELNHDLRVLTVAVGVIPVNRGLERSRVLPAQLLVGACDHRPDLVVNQDPRSNLDRDYDSAIHGMEPAINWRFRRDMVCGDGLGFDKDTHLVCIGDHHVDDHDDFNRDYKGTKANSVYVDRFVYEHPWVSFIFRRLRRYRGSYYNIPTLWGTSMYHPERDMVDVMPIPFNIITGYPRKIWRWMKYGVR